MKIHFKRTAALGCCAAIALSSLAGCSSVEEPVLDTTVMVEVQAASRGSISLEGTYVGEISPAESVSVIPMASGTVTDVNVTVGSTVTEGQTLAKLDSEGAELQLTSAQASYDSALASVQSTLGGQWHLQSYSTQSSIDSIVDGIDTINDTINDLNDSKDDAKKARDAARQAYNSARAGAVALSLGAVEVTVTDTNKNLVDGYNAQDNQVGDTLIIAITDAASMDTLCNIARLSSENGISEEAKKSLNELREYGLSYGELTLDPEKLTEETIKELATAYQSAESAYQSVKDGIESAENQKETTEKSLKTAQDSQYITDTEVYNDTVNQLQKSLAAAQVGIDSAQYQLGLYTITSPINGIVESVNVTKDSIAGSSVAFVISNKESMTVTFYVTEDVRNSLSEGQAITVARSGQQYSGAVTEIGTAVDQTRGLFKIKATIYGGESLSTGSTATVSLVNHTLSNVILIPCDAVYYDNDGAYVFVAQDGVAVQTRVETDLYDADRIAITSGLSVGDQVITTWSANLMDGAKVAVPGQETEAAEAAQATATAAGADGSNG